MDGFSSSSVNTSTLSHDLNHRDMAQAFVAAVQSLARQKGSVDPYAQVLAQQQDFPIPHQFTYASVWNWYQKYYYNYFDESLINSQQNSLAMWRDGLICELHWHRTLPTMSLPHTVECDDDDDPGQVKIKKQAIGIIDRLPYFQNLKQQLLQAVFFGKSGSQCLYGWKKIAGKERFTLKSHSPIQGDKIVYGWSEDQKGDIPGIFVYRTAPPLQDPNMKKHVRFMDKGPALMLETDFLRDQFIIHNFNPTDTDYLFESEKALMVHGRGMRDWLYWIWNMRAEVLSWNLDALQRVGANGMLYGFFPTGDAQAQSAIMKALADLIMYNIAAFPKPPGGDASSVIGNIVPSAVGYDVLFQLIQHFEEIIRRCYLGQNLSSESAPTGLGSGVADLQSGSFQNIVLFDAGCLSETIDNELFQKIIKYNIWEYNGKMYRGADLPFSLRFKIQVERDNVAELINAAAQLIQMGVPLDVEDLRDKAGFVAPKNKATTIAMPGGQTGGIDNQHALASEHNGKPGSNGHANGAANGKSRQPNPSFPALSSSAAKRPTQSEHFAAIGSPNPLPQPLIDQVAYELANCGSTLVFGGWFHSNTDRAWVSVSENISFDELERLSNALEFILGLGKYKIVTDQSPVGAGWIPISTDPYIIEPEWYSKSDNCGTGAGGFKPGNDCAAGTGSTQEKLGRKSFGRSKAKVRDLFGMSDPTSTPEQDVEKAAKKNLKMSLTHEDIATLAGLPDDSHYTFNDGEWNTLTIQSDTEKFFITRTIKVNPSDGKKYIKNDGFFIRNPEDQGKGLGLEVFGRQVEEAIKHGFSHISIFADRDDSDNPLFRTIGYKVWPKFGYDAPIPDRIKDLAQTFFPDAERISDLYMTKEGREWWEKYGTGETMTFDLAEGSLSRRIWEAYLEKKSQEGINLTSQSETKKSPMKSGIASESPEKFQKDRSEDPGAMIALWIPRDVAESLQIPGGEDPEEFHVTLAYLGRVSEIGSETVEMASKVCEMLASNTPALSGRIGGIGRFAASQSSDGMGVIYLNVDSPSLTDLRSELVSVLRMAKIPFKNNHGFTPHITLAYIDPENDIPMDQPPDIEIEFGSLFLAVGNDRQEFPFMRNQEVLNDDSSSMYHV